MTAQECQVLATAPESVARRQSYMDTALRETLAACQRAAADGQFTQYFKIPKEYADESVAALRSLGYAVTLFADTHAAVDVIIDWSKPGA